VSPRLLALVEEHSASNLALEMMRMQRVEAHRSSLEPRLQEAFAASAPASLSQAALVTLALASTHGRLLADAGFFELLDKHRDLTELAMNEFRRLSAVEAIAHAQSFSTRPLPPHRLGSAKTLCYFLRLAEQEGCARHGKLLSLKPRGSAASHYNVPLELPLRVTTELSQWASEPRN